MRRIVAIPASPKPQPEKTFLSAIYPFKIIVGVVLVILAAGLVFGFAWNRKTVTLVDYGKEEIVKTRTATVGELLYERNIAIGRWDRVDPGPDERLADQSRVVISRAFRVDVLADGDSVSFYSTAGTVGEALAEKNIEVGLLDIVAPSVNESITADITVWVTRVLVKSEFKKAVLENGVKREANPSMARGISRTIMNGSSGEEKLVWQVTYHDGKEVNRSLLDRQTTVKPVDKVLQYGTGQEVSRGGQAIRFKHAIDVVATAYTSTGNNTATGIKPKYGIIAVDPSVIPLGARLYVEGYGYAKAMDKGSDIKGNRIDVFLETRADALRWGRRSVRVYVLE